MNCVLIEGAFILQRRVPCVWYSIWHERLRGGRVSALRTARQQATVSDTVLRAHR